MDKAGNSGTENVASKQGNSLKVALAMFVKTPGLSPVKTRLAQSIGRKEADEFFILCVKVFEQFAQGVSAASEGNIHSFWAIGEQEGLDDKIWKKLPGIYTGSGGMGNRLYHVYSTLLKDYEAVILVGADSPQIEVSMMIDIYETLSRKNKFILGPTFDGGFYLFAGKEPIEKKFWLKVTYSTSKTAKELIDSLQPLGEITLLDYLVDVDDVDDLVALYHETEKSHSPYLIELRDWVRSMVNFQGRVL